MIWSTSHESGHVDVNRFPGTKTIKSREGNQVRADNLVHSNWRRRPGSNRFNECLPFTPVTFVCPDALMTLCIPSGFDHLQPHEVVKDCNLAIAEHLKSLLTEGSIAAGRIDNSSYRAIVVRNGDDHLITERGAIDFGSQRIDTVRSSPSQGLKQV